MKIDSGYLEVYMTPEDGSRVLVLSLRNGEDCKPGNFDTTFTFQIWQHVKIEVFGEWDGDEGNSVFLLQLWCCCFR